VGEPMAAQRKDDFKKVIEKIRSGNNLQEIKEYFSEILGIVPPGEFAFFENELSKDGVSSHDIKVMQGIQLTLFNKSVETQEPLESAGHPIFTLMSEHALLMEYVNELRSLVSFISSDEQEVKPQFLKRIRELIGYFIESESHYQREENAVFPVLEKHGLTGPPAAMWSEHQEIHKLEKEIFSLNIENEKDLLNNLLKLSGLVSSLSDRLADHFYKENNILFPASIRLFSAAEWDIIVQDFDDIGYSSYTQRPVRKKVESDDPVISESGEVSFGSGTLTLEQLELLFNNLPVDTTFVDEQDRVRFFSESPDRIFVRSRAVIGRSVQLCHPKDSIHAVQEILDDFRAGKRNNAEFWIDLGGKTIHIRYFAMRNDNGTYLGCLEVSQDITEIKKITGEKRLLEG
jgi:PAS domain S-box-containing protein